MAASELEIPIESYVIFEVAEASIEAAHRAGMRAVGIGKSIALKHADMVNLGLYQLVIPMQA